MPVIKIHLPGEFDCPVCGLLDGFHQYPHSDVPKEYFKEKGWYKNAATDV